MSEVVKVRKRYALTSNMSLVIKVGEVVKKANTNQFSIVFEIQSSLHLGCTGKCELCISLYGPENWLVLMYFKIYCFKNLSSNIQLHIS